MLRRRRLRLRGADGRAVQRARSGRAAGGRGGAQGGAVRRDDAVPLLHSSSHSRDRRSITQTRRRSHPDSVPARRPPELRVADPDPEPDLVARDAGSRSSPITGPVGIAQATGEVVHQAGWQSLIQLAALDQHEPGVFNVLPIPMVDGGRLHVHIHRVPTTRQAYRAGEGSAGTLRRVRGDADPLRRRHVLRHRRASFSGGSLLR